MLVVVLVLVLGLGRFFEDEYEDENDDDTPAGLSKPHLGPFLLLRSMWRICNELALSGMNDVGKFLVVAGLILAAVGAVLWSGIGKGWLGRLPGDIHYTKGNFSFYFPLATCLLISVVLTLLMWLFRK